MDDKIKIENIKDYMSGELIKASQSFSKRVMIGIPTTGLVRIEWVMARYAQVIPCNWSQVETLQGVNEQVTPLGFLVAEARNVIVKRFIEADFEWLFFIDHDVVLPPFTFLVVNERIIKGDVPVFGGLYFTKSVPAEPLVYRGRGSGYFADWKLGDEVWVDGLPMGCTVIHRDILETMYDDAEEYQAGDITLRRVFETPARCWYDPEKNSWFGATGTEDLLWCSRVIENKIFRRTHWGNYEDMEYPFLVDTKLLCKHIDQSGIQYPVGNELKEFKKSKEERRLVDKIGEKSKGSNQ